MSADEIKQKFDQETQDLEAFLQSVSSEIAFRRGRIQMLADLLNQLLPAPEGDADGNRSGI